MVKKANDLTIQTAASFASRKLAALEANAKAVMDEVEEKASDRSFKLVASGGSFEAIIRCGNLVAHVKDKDFAVDIR